MALRFAIFAFLAANAAAFWLEQRPKQAPSWRPAWRHSLFSTTPDNAAVSIDPKEIVKIFGRLAEKYIVLDETAGLCCYSACSDCEFRLPDGGYRMADQSAARPKWIPCYADRSIGKKEHASKWSQELFVDGSPSLAKEEFCERLANLQYAPSLGGPYLAASAAEMDDTTSVETLFDALIAGNLSSKNVLTRHRMEVRLKELANGEEGLMWDGFAAVFDSSR